MDQRPLLPVDAWLLGPDRHDFPWKVHLLGPRLTFQQRYLEQVRVTIPANAVNKGSARHDLHFLVKVANDQGKWLEPDSYTHYRVPPKLDSSTELQFGVGFYIRPGRYTFAVFAFDSESGEGNLWRSRVSIPPLPQLGHELPAVEFVDDFPQDTVVGDSRNWLHGSPRRGGKWTISMMGDGNAPIYYLAGSEENGETWGLGHGQGWLPIATVRPVRLDLILNFSERLDPKLKYEDPARTNRINAGRLLQISSLLGHVKMRTGCVRLNVLDMLRMQTILDSVDTTAIDWDKFQETIRNLDRNTIEIGKLEARNNASMFFRDSVAKVMSDSTACDSSGVPPLHAIIIAVSSALRFPSGTKIEYIRPDNRCNCRLYYLRPQNGMQDWEDDDVERMLKLLNPRRLTPSTPLEFRKQLFLLIADLQAASGGKATP